MMALSREGYKPLLRRLRRHRFPRRRLPKKSQGLRRRKYTVLGDGCGYFALYERLGGRENCDPNFTATASRRSHVRYLPCWLV